MNSHQNNYLQNVRKSMEEKRPIDRIRESSGHFDIGSIENGAIVEMKTIGNRLLIIKERSIYELVFADTIGPGRTNISTHPTIHKLIINKGTESETVSRIFLTAKTLFRPEYILPHVIATKCLALQLIYCLISLLEKETKDYHNREDQVSNEYAQKKVFKKVHWNCHLYQT